MTLTEKYNDLVSFIDSNYFSTWFELGLFMDKVRDSQSERFKPFESSYDDFLENVGQGIAFVTFYYAIDGVSIEVAKYANAFEKLIGKEKTNIHLIAGDFRKGYESIMDPSWKTMHIEGSDGFDVWDGYEEFFKVKLSRGSKEYNELIKKIISQTKEITLTLAKYVSENNINLLFPINTNSNPGNISLALSIMLVSELMSIPVINSSHDFYWEGGKREQDRKKNDEAKGVRDHFFTNAGVGEVFSPIEMLFPWDSKSWLQTTINTSQIKNLISTFGFNPINLMPLPTSVDTDLYLPVTEDRKKDILSRFKNILARGKSQLESECLKTFIESKAQEWYDVQKPLFLSFKEGSKCNLSQEDIIFLQPTRIITRKDIQRNFTLIKNLFKCDAFTKYLDSNKEISVIHHTTGPIAVGHNKYFLSLLDNFQEAYSDIPEKYRDRVFLSFTFGTELNKVAREKSLEPLHIDDIFCIASTILLPSKTEGRGLPIIEASATGIPIVSNRYDPIEVYKEVVGEDLDDDNKLRILEFPASENNDLYPEELIEDLTKILTDKDVKKEIQDHNIKVVKKRFSSETLMKSIDSALKISWFRSKRNQDSSKLKEAIKIHKDRTSFDKLSKSLVHQKRRSYLPGYTQIEFMIYLKSLIDPSFFRIEEKEVKARAMLFAQDLFDNFSKNHKIEEELKFEFFSLIDDLFDYNEGNDKLAIDHSLSYRHRNRKHFPYRKLTEQELHGVISQILRSLVGENILPVIDEAPRKFQLDLEKSIKTYFEANALSDLGINDFDQLKKELNSPRPIALFLDKSVHSELTIFGLNYIKQQLNIPEGETLNDDNFNPEKPSKIFIFAREEAINSPITFDSVTKWLGHEAPSELRFLFKKKFIEVVKTKILSAGVHLQQLGPEASKALINIKNNNGLLISFGFDSFITLDLLDIPSCRIGKVRNELEANFMDIPLNSSFLQFVPAGLRPSLAYPTPIQTPEEFSRVFKGGLFKHCVHKFGRKKVLDLIYKDADEFGTPLNTLLDQIRNEDPAERPFVPNKINGIHHDGLPWSGAMVTVNLTHFPWSFNIIEASRSGSTVKSLVEEYEKEKNLHVEFAWNGGYILNPELVGKLGISESYIGSPLGLLVTEGKIRALPLFNKPTLALDKNHKIIIKRANLENGFSIITPDKTFKVSGNQRNTQNENDIVFYDLMYDSDDIPATGRIIYRFVGTKIIEKIENQETVKVLPVGITLSVPTNHPLSKLSIGDELNFTIPGWDDYESAIEAGPLLVEDGKIAIDMELGGWKTPKSILTQAARLDFTDMRGPKIAAGITGSNELIVIAVNGRIRESVGATHIDMAEIMIEYGAKTVIGFDPGGSATLFAGGEQLNVSPYNKDYEENTYSQPPEPRRVGNAIIGTLKK